MSLFAVLDNPHVQKLPPAAKLVLIYLTWRQGANGTAWPSTHTIAHDLKLDERHCRRLLRDIETAGCIQKTSAGIGGRGHSNHYSLVIDKGGQETPVSFHTKGGRKPPFKSHKGGQKLHKRGAYNPPKEEEVTRRVRVRAKFIPPTLEEVAVYADSLGDPDFPAERFIEYYTAMGWRHKHGGAVRDWKATVRTWWRRDNEARVARGEPPHDGYSQYGTHPATAAEIEKLRAQGVFG